MKGVSCRKVGLCIMTLFLFMTGTALAASKDLRIGYVDLQRVINESEAGKDARKRFSEEIKKRQEELNKRQEEISNLREEYRKKVSILKEEVKREKEREIAEKSRSLQEFISLSERELLKKESQLTGEIIKDIQAIVRDYAKEKGYTYIFEKMEGGILYGPEGDDLTDEIIKRYNEKYKAIRGKKE